MNKKLYLQTKPVKGKKILYTISYRITILYYLQTFLLD